MQSEKKRPLITAETKAKRVADANGKRDAAYTRRIYNSLVNALFDTPHKDARGTVTLLCRAPPNIYKWQEELDSYDGEEGSVQAFIDRLPANDRFTVVSSTFDPHTIVEMLATGLVLVDRENDECLYSITHGPERELEYDPASVSSSSLIARIHEEVNPRHRDDLCLVAIEHGDDSMRPEPRVWLEFPDIHRDKMPPRMLWAIASAMLDCSFFVMTGEGACQRLNLPGIKPRPAPTKLGAHMSALNLQSPGYLPRAKLYMRVKGFSAEF